ncbi:MAG: hypothetical protein ACKD6N_03600 [Candidatus Bathyarchaeota archaeon]
MVKIGLDENVIDLLNIGNVTRITRKPVKTYARHQIPFRHTVLQPLGTAETLYTIEGLISQNVNENIQKLLNLYQSQKTVILETSSFTVAGKITNLEIPSESGEKFTRYRLELSELPFWGTTSILEGENVYLTDLDYQNKAREIYPTHGRYNFVVDRTSKKFSWELILVNEKEESENFYTLFDDNQTSFWSISGSGTGNRRIASITNVTNPLMRGSNCLKIVLDENGTYYRPSIRKEFSPTIDISSYDYLAFWFYGQNSGTQIDVVLHDGSLVWIAWTTYDNWVGWRRIVLPLRNPDGKGGTFNYTSLYIMLIYFYTGSGVYYLDRGGFDFGHWTKLEVQTPDNIKKPWYFSQSGGNIYSYVPNVGYKSQPQGYGWCSHGGNPECWNVPPNDDDTNRPSLTFLDGTTVYKAYGTGYWNKHFTGWCSGLRGQTANPLAYTSGAAGQITYSQTYGCMKRIAFAISMPPWTGCDNLTGRFAINKVRLKIETFYEKEETSYIW